MSTVSTPCGSPFLYQAWDLAKERIREGVSSETYTPSRNFTREEDRQIAGERRPAALIFPCLCLVHAFATYPFAYAYFLCPCYHCARVGAVISASNEVGEAIDWKKVSAALASVLGSQTRKQMRERWHSLRCGP